MEAGVQARSEKVKLESYLFPSIIAELGVLTIIRYITIKEAFCDDCKKDLHTRDGWGYVPERNEKHYCLDCAIKRGLLDPLEWINSKGVYLKWDHADYKDGVVTGYVRCGKGFRHYQWEV